MAITVLDAAARSAINAAASGPVGTREAGVVNALASAFTEAVTAELYDAADNLLCTVALGAWEVDEVSDPRKMTVGATGATTFANAGVPAAVLFRSGATAIFECSAGVGSGDVSFQDQIRAGVSVSFGPVAFTSPTELDGLPLVWGDVPSPIVLDAGGTFDLGAYVSGGEPPYTVSVSGSLPSGVSLVDGVLSAASGAAIGLSGDLVFSAEDTSPQVTSFSVVSAVGGADLPFTIGHVFAQGDVPSGSYAESGLSDWQVTPTTTWPDGSLRHAIIAGRATLSAGVALDVSISVSGSARSGVALTESDLAAAMPATTLAIAGHSTIDVKALVGTGAKHRTVCAGPVMGNWIYRAALSGSTTLVAWFDVRLYKGGRVELFPWIENGFLTGDAPATVTLNPTLTMGGSVRFSQALTVAYRTRIPLLTSSHTTFAHWSDDPQVTPSHDAAYMRASKMVPNYGWTSPSEATLNGLLQTYTPNTLAGISTAMGAAGSSAALLQNPQALYCTTGDARAYRSAIVFGLSGGSWSVHLRDSEYGHEPFSFALRPNVSEQDGSPATPVGTGTGNGTAVTTHQPSYGYLPWLITGRWWFLDESLFWAGWNYWKASPNQRRGLLSSQDLVNYPALFASAEVGIADSANGTYVPRGAAWTIRTLAQSLAIVPAAHPCYESLRVSVQSNAEFYAKAYVTGEYPRDAGAAPRMGNALGYMGEYGNPYGNSTYWIGSGWMWGMLFQSFGFVKSLDLPIGTTPAGWLTTVVNHCMQYPIGLSGGVPGWNYRRFTVYGGAIGDGTTYELFDGFAEALAAQEANYSLGTIDSSTGLSLKQHTSNTDLISNSSSWPYFGQQFAALVYAVEHGVSGASAGFSNITSASNYSTVVQAFNDDPSYGILPRSA